MNKQITEDYVSYEIAKLLKEKGFPQLLGDDGCVNKIPYYCPNGNLWTGDIGLLRQRYFNEASAPTHQMALKWLREVHDLHIIVYPWQADKEEKAIHWCCKVYKSFAHLGNDVYTNETPKSYEQAIETALLYVLKNLI